MDTNEALEQRISALEKNLLFVSGKGMGLEAAVMTLAREWGNEPKQVLEALDALTEKMGGQEFNGVHPHARDAASQVIQQVRTVVMIRSQ